MIGRGALLAALGGTVATVLTRKSHAQTGDTPVAATKYGKVRGAAKDGVNAFKGIPYGGTTAGARFKPASAPAPWTEVRDALEFPPMSPQPVSNPTGLFVGSPHSLEHAFVFDNVAVSESMTGPATGKTQAMVDQIGSAWLAFARTGNPNNPRIPNWPAYKAPERATMVFDTESKAINAFRDDERKLLAEVNGRGPYD
jgi:carboxylesterase type B